MRIAKLSGAGNDFVAIDPAARERLGDRFADWVRAVCRRGVSIGADGVLVVGPAPDGRVRVEFRNPDGSEAFCGNGTRCAARLASHRGLAGSEALLVTSIGEVRARIGRESVTLTLPPPRDLGALVLETPAGTIPGRRVLAGVPHFLYRVEDLPEHPLAVTGPFLRRHEAFGPEGTNVDPLAWDDPGTLRIRTFERGVEGETLACGSGAIAAALVARLAGAPERVTILPASGIPLAVTLEGPADAPEHAVLEGDARLLVDGETGEGIEEPSGP